MPQQFPNPKVGDDLGRDFLPVLFNAAGAANAEGSPLAESCVVLDFENPDGSRLRLITTQLSAELLCKALSEVKRRLGKLAAEAN